MFVVTLSISIFYSLESACFPMKIEQCEIYRTSSLKFYLYSLHLPSHFGLTDMDLTVLVIMLSLTAV